MRRRTRARELALQFLYALEARGVELLVVPVPAKGMFDASFLNHRIARDEVPTNPDHERFIAALRARSIDVVDLIAPFREWAADPELPVCGATAAAFFTGLGRAVAAAAFGGRFDLGLRGLSGGGGFVGRRGRNDQSAFIVSSIFFRRSRHVEIEFCDGQKTQSFDQVVLACHSDQALSLVGDASPAEREVLGAIRYQSNEAILHTDVSLMPKRRRAWAAWNYHVPQNANRHVAVTYNLNILQGLRT